jgi:hypothetical protein
MRMSKGSKENFSHEEGNNGVTSSRGRSRGPSLQISKQASFPFAQMAQISDKRNVSLAERGNNEKEEADNGQYNTQSEISSEVQMFEEREDDLSDHDMKESPLNTEIND